MVVCEDIPEGIKKFYNDWSADRNGWLRRAKKAEEYYLNDVDETGTTFTQRQVQNITKNTNIPVNLNFLYPMVHSKLATIVQTKPSFQVVTTSQEKEKKEYAYVIDKAVFNLLRNSYSLSKIESHGRDMLISGMGLLGWDERDIVTPGTFEFELVYYTYEEIILDAASRLKEGTDARGFFIEKEIPLDYANFKFREIVELINSYYEKKYTIESLASPSGKTPEVRGDKNRFGMGQKTVVWKRFVDRIFTTMYYVRNPETEDIEFLFKENYFPEQIDAIFNEETVVGQEQGFFVRKTDILGDKMILFNVKPYTQLPIKATYYEWGGRPYKSYGMVHYELGKNDAIDKAVQLMIMNGILTNNAGWTGPEGSLTPAQKEIWKQAGNDPRVFKEYKPIVINDQIFIPKRDEVPQLSNFYPQLILLLKQSMELSTGIDPATSMGILQEGKVEVFSSLQQYQNAAMRRIELSTNQINFTMEYLGNIAIEYLIATVKPSEAYIWLDEQGKTNELNVLKSLVKDFKLTKYKLIATPAEAHPSQKIAMATELFKIAQTATNEQDRNIYIKKAFELMDMRGYDELLEEISEVNKLTRIIQEMEEQIKRDEELKKQYENKAINAEVKNKILAKYVQLVEGIIKEGVAIEKQIEIDTLKKQMKELSSGE
jgi:hypothetical protein